MGRVLFETIIYTVELRQLIDFKLNPWAERVLILQADLYQTASNLGMVCGRD
jgi:hypothetical protein